MAEEYLFSLKGLAVGYRGKALIENIQVRLKRGQILTLIGPNGAGKSTILKTITRQLSPIAGMAYIGKRELSSYSARELARQMSVVLTEHIRPEMMTCFDVAAMGRYPYTGRFGTLTKEDREIVSHALRRGGAEDIARQEFTHISDGQRQRVLLARALCQEPEILVLDEPTSFLDIRHKIDLLDILLEESRERQLTVVLSLHEIDLAEKISDWILCVKEGKISRAGTPEEVFTQEGIQQLYGIRQGSYLTRRGSVELKKPEGAPRVFVIGGAGWGLIHYRALQKARIPFAAGILFENDLEYEVALALASQVISVPAFSEIGDKKAAEAERVLCSCQAVLDAGTPVGKMNRPNEALLRLAREKGLPILKSIQEWEGRA